MNKISTILGSATIKSPKGFENNPFYVATKGLDLLFEKAQSLGVLIAVLGAAFMIMMSGPDSSSTTSEQPAQPVNNSSGTEPFTSIPPEAWFVIGTTIVAMLAVLFVISIVIRGVLDYTSAQLAKNKSVTTTEAFHAVFENFWGYTWVIVIASIKTLLWLLLFIVPGIIMSVRYSLAGVSFFDKKLRGNAAVTHSSQMVKGAWLTTFASQNLFGILTLGIIQPLLVPGANGVLYRQLMDAGATKPKAHWLSWLTLILLILLLSFVVALISLVVNYSHAA